MGYANDQFFNITTTGGEPSVAPGNPPFIYPDRTVRFLSQHGHPVSKQLQRGYIRSLTTKGGIAGNQQLSIPIQKCQFQFNPQTLTQSVSQNPSMQNFLQQDPAQYAQPMIGNVNFTFDLFFDRSMELNKPDTGGYNPSTSRYEPTFNELNPWEKSDPSQVGVLRDLAVLYSVIGQGMSEMQKDYVRSALEQNVIVEANTATDAGDDTSASSAKAISNIPSFLENNIGNSAFLLPLPVRVVFSSLYIVEGLVTDSTVVFTKFTTNYVPMQAAVSLTMEAKYIGFSKPNTFFTWVLDQRANEELREANGAIAAKNETVSAMADLVSKVKFDVDTELTVSAPSTVRTRLQARMPLAQAAIDKKTVTDPVSQLFNEATISAVEIAASVRAYGPFGNDSLLTASQAALASQINDGYGNLQQLFQCAITSTNDGARATTVDQWKDMADGAEGDWITTSFSNDQVYEDDVTIYHYTVSVSVRQGESLITGTGEKYVAFKGDFVRSGSDADEVPVRWPNLTPVIEEASSGITVSGTVPPDNASSTVSRTQPGSSSNVGAPLSSRGGVLS